MKILYLVEQGPDETLKKIMEEQRKANDTAVVNLKENKNYDQIIDLIFSHDKVISW